jgi:hypothetical protein
MIKMGVVLRRPINILTATAGVGSLVAALAAIDPRVRTQIALIVSGRGSTGEFGSAFANIRDVTSTVMLAVRDQSMTHAPLTIFALAALVLVLFMTRT